MVCADLRAVDRALSRSSFRGSDRDDALADAVHHRDESQRHPRGDPQRLSSVCGDGVARRVCQPAHDWVRCSRISQLGHRRARARHAGRRVRAVARASAGVLLAASLSRRDRLATSGIAAAARRVRADRRWFGGRTDRAVLRSLLRLGSERRLDRRHELRGEAGRLSATSVRRRDRHRDLPRVCEPIREQESGRDAPQHRYRLEDRPFFSRSHR